MKSFIITSILIIIGTFVIADAFADHLILKPENTASITSPYEARDKRILVYFNIPEFLYNKNVRIDYAKLVFDARVTKAFAGQIEVYPLATSWKNSGSIGWEQPWSTLGGDINLDQPGKHMALKSTDGMKNLRCDVTYIMMDWTRGKLDNNGLIIIPSQADLENCDVEYSIDTYGIELVVRYEVE